MFNTFKINDVFYKIDTPKIKAKANDFPTEYSTEYSVPLLTAGAENQGLNRYAKSSDCPEIINNAISVSANGANSGVCFYQPYDFAVLQDAYAIKVNGREIKNVEEGLYLTGALNKSIRDNHDWVNKAGWNNIKNDDIKLPVIEVPATDYNYTIDDIDWNYMSKYIKELEYEHIEKLERDRITELDAYLQASGLNDYELTEDDKNILALSAKREFAKDETLEDNSEDKVRFGEFLLEKLFTASTGDVDLQQKDINGKGNFFINSGVENRGVKGKTDREARVFPVNTITIDFWGNAYYRDFEYKMATHNHVFSLSGDVIRNENVGHYIVGTLSKIPQLFSYNNMATWNKLKVLNISLPIKTDAPEKYTTDDIDFDYMECYIRAIEKLVIADVVKYKDKVIETTKKVIEK